MKVQREDALSLCRFSEVDYSPRLKFQRDLRCADVGTGLKWSFDLLKDKERDFVAEIPMCDGSEYAGSTVSRANYEYIVKVYGKCPWLKTISGGYNTYGIALDVRAFLSSKSYKADLLADLILDMKDYPVANESFLLDWESKQADTEWETWARDAYARGILKKFGREIVGDFRGMFERIAYERCNFYWHAEGSGHDMFIDVDAVIKATTYQDIEPFIVPVDSVRAKA